MGKRELRVIVIRRRVTGALLILLSAGMLTLTWFLSGKAYQNDARGPAEEVLTVVQFGSLAALMPLAADVFAFLPWGFLAFMVFDMKRRPRFRSYLFTSAAAVAFSVGMVIWQYTLPTRVTSFGDTIFNFAGALLGASLGHLRRAVRVRFL